MIQSIEQVNQSKSLIEELRSLVQEDWVSMNKEIQDQLHSDIGLINSISHYIINSGGKRLRPLIVLLAYSCLLYTSPSPRDGLLSRMPSSA